MKNLVFLLIFCIFAQVANAQDFSWVQVPTTNQNFIFHNHLVKSGESVEKISRMYYGTENLTVLLLDNQWLNDRFFFSSLRGTKIYIIHPGDVLVVRVYGATLNPNPVQESVVVRSEPWEKSPWFWIGGGLLLLTMLALAWVIGGRSRQFMGYGYYPYPTQPLPAPVAPQPQQGSYTHTHEHRFPPMTMNVVYTPTPAPVAPTASAKTEAGASAPASQ